MGPGSKEVWEPCPRPPTVSYPSRTHVMQLLLLLGKFWLPCLLPYFLFIFLYFMMGISTLGWRGNVSFCCGFVFAHPAASLSAICWVLSLRNVSDVTVSAFLSACYYFCAFVLFFLPPTSVGSCFPKCTRVGCLSCGPEETTFIPVLVQNAGQFCVARTGVPLGGKCVGLVKMVLFGLAL